MCLYMYMYVSTCTSGHNYYSICIYVALLSRVIIYSVHLRKFHVADITATFLMPNVFQISIKYMYMYIHVYSLEG